MSALPSDDHIQDSKNQKSEKKIQTNKGAPTNIQIGAPFLSSNREAQPSIEPTDHAPEQPKNQPDQTDLTDIKATLPDGTLWTPNWQDQMYGRATNIPLSAHLPSDHTLAGGRTDGTDDAQAENYASVRADDEGKQRALPRRHVKPKVDASDPESSLDVSKLGNFVPVEAHPPQPSDDEDEYGEQNSLAQTGQLTQQNVPGDQEEEERPVLDITRDIAGPTGGLGRWMAVGGTLGGAGLLTTAALNSADSATTAVLHLIHTFFA